MSENQQETRPAVKRFRAESKCGCAVEGNFARIVDAYPFSSVELTAITELARGGVLQLGSCIVTRLL
jgi:hypothetical protein